MSNTTVYPLNDPTIFEQARADARARAAYSWALPNTWNMWTEYRTTFNPDWFDPWFEDEVHGNYNGPSTGDSDPAYELTQNLYFAYCFLKWKGYNNYAIMAMMTAAIQESTISGGVWENPKPYDTLVNFDPTSLSSGISAHTWYKKEGSKPDFSSGKYSSSPTQASFTGINPDTGNPYTWTKSYVAGSYEMVNKYSIETYYYMPGHIEVPVGWNSGGPYLDYRKPNYGGTAGAVYMRGYGIFQWSPWTKLPDVAKIIDQQGDPNFANADRHYQMSATMQLMILEIQRAMAMTDNQSGSDYKGQWIDSNAIYNGNPDNPRGAYFNWSSAYGSGGITGTYHDITWDSFARGDFISEYNDLINAMENQPPTLADRQWYLRQYAIRIWEACFEQTGYQRYSVEAWREKSQYVMAAINYWETHYINPQYGGYDPADIPRPRDMEYSDLDWYHVTSTTIPFLTNRRRRCRHVSTILF